MPIWAYFAIYLACAPVIALLLGKGLREASNGYPVPEEELRYPCEPTGEPRVRRLREREPAR